MAALMMLSGPEDLPSMSLLIDDRKLSVVKGGVHPVPAGWSGMSDKSQGTVGPPVALKSKSACSEGILVS